MTVCLVVAGVHAKKNKLKGELTVALEFLKKLCHQHGILAAGDADGDPVPVLNLPVFDDGARKGVEKITVKMSLLQRKLNVFTKLAVPRLSGDGMKCPRTIAAGKALRSKAKILQLFRKLSGHGSVFAVQDDAFVFGKRRKAVSFRIFAHLSGRKKNAARDKAVLVVALFPGVHQNIIIGTELIQLRGRYFERQFGSVVLCHHENKPFCFKKSCSGQLSDFVLSFIVTVSACLRKGEFPMTGNLFHPDTLRFAGNLRKSKTEFCTNLAPIFEGIFCSRHPTFFKHSSV